MNIDKVYAQCERIILQEVRRHHGQYGGEAADILQEARRAFLEAVKSYDPKRGNLGKRVRYVVRHELFEVVRTHARRERICPILRHSDIAKTFASMVDQYEASNTETSVNGGPLLDKVDESSLSRFNLSDLLDELTEDARAIVRIVLDVPSREFRKGGDFRPRRALREYLTRKGWGDERINTGFAEIQAALA